LVSDFVIFDVLETFVLRRFAVPIVRYAEHVLRFIGDSWDLCGESMSGALKNIPGQGRFSELIAIHVNGLRKGIIDDFVAQTHTRVVEYVPRRNGDN